MKLFPMKISETGELRTSANPANIANRIADLRGNRSLFHLLRHFPAFLPFPSFFISFNVSFFAKKVENRSIMEFGSRLSV